jgi:NADPH:quinone reductase-like Zn-dependent oxidoreductase
MQVNDNGSALAPAELPQPKPSPGEVLIRVHAAGVTPTELMWSPTTQTKDGGQRKGAVPGHEFSGTIAALGSDVKSLQVADEVYGMNDWFADGATAEFCVTVPSSIAPKPKSLSHQEAATVHIGALTAWQGLFDRAKLQRGERVLIHGAAGAVGIFAVQLARRAGAHVIATASAADIAFLRQLGAREVIDYRGERFEQKAINIDVVFDAVGDDTLARSWQVLKPNGRLVTIAASSESASDSRASDSRTSDLRTKDAFFIVEPEREQLVEVASLIDSGELSTFVGAAVPLEQAGAAYRREIAATGKGKVVVSIPAITG